MRQREVKKDNNNNWEVCEWGAKSVNMEQMKAEDDDLLFF